MAFGYQYYRKCPICGFIGALSNHGKNRGKMAGHVLRKCPRRHVKWKKFPWAYPEKVQKAR